MIRFLKKYALFLFFLPLFVVIHIEKELHHLVIYRFVLIQIVVLFLLPAFFLIFFYLFNKDFKKSAIQAFAVLLFYYFFGEFKNYLSARYQEQFLISYTFLLPVSFIIISAALYKIQKSVSRFHNAFLFLNICLALFIVADTVEMVFKRNKWQALESETLNNYQPCDTCLKPDIYYIVFDSYTSSGMLQSEFSFDNSAIEDSLKNRGFRVLQQATSNYNLTPYSIGSTLDMQYLPDADTTQEYYTRNLFPPLKIVYYNILFPILQKEGYKIYNHSIFNTKSYPTTIRLFDGWGINELYRQYNFILKSYDDIGYHLPGWLKSLFDNKQFFKKAAERDRIDREMKNQLFATTSVQTGDPKFVYVHFSKPHGPYTYNLSGEFIEPIPMLTAGKAKSLYASQVGYMNSWMNQITDTILKQSKRPVAIIVQGDHGYRDIEDEPHKQFPVFHAVYYHDKNYGALSDSLSNVNTFRLIFRKYFRKDVELLENRSFHLKFK